ncbi:MAG TPA: Hsp20/alpha crystallin family protein [Thermoanaerobaculia bacterium]|nr:Hsp20/alpha crystallin family protein [Thermoanaerobaculia bacterium]
MRSALTRWTPTGDLVRDRFGRLFEDAFNDMLRPLGEAEGVASRAWLPSVDIRETDEALTLLVDLPGMKKEDVNLTLENNVLTLNGERKFADEKKNENYHRIERAYGSFTRSFTLPQNVQPERVEANFHDGVLEIMLPKAEESKPRRISIK